MFQMKKIRVVFFAGVLGVMVGSLPCLVSAEEPPVDPLLDYLGPLVVDGGQKTFVFNSKLVPGGEDELRQLQMALQEVLSDSLEALVGIEVSGASGTGVIVSSTGLVLSAAHVVMAPGTRIKFVMADGTVLDGETLGIISGSDAGMARIIDEGEYPFVPISDYSKLSLGDWCFALGHAGGVDEERGPVVRLGRVLRLRPDTLQSDCKLIGGDSGGPIFDMAGRLIGINSRVGMNVEQSLHVAISEFLNHDEEMRKGIAAGQDLSPFLGVTLEPWLEGVEDGEEEDGGVAGVAAEVTGLIITEVNRGSPGGRGGLKKGDIVLAIDGVEVRSVREAGDVVSRRQAGERALLFYIPVDSEDGEPVEKWIRLGARTGFSVPG